MDVVFLCVHDWANVGSLFARSLRGVGVKAHSLAFSKHVFNYKGQGGKWTTPGDVQRAVDEVDRVVLMHSRGFQSVNLKGKKVAVFHGGSFYRQHATKLNRYFNKFCDFSIVQTGDLLQLNPKNPKWVMPPVDTGVLVPGGKSNHKRVFAHYPSNPLFKGSEDIKEVMEKIQVEFRCDLETMQYSEHIGRVLACDVYIERMALVRGKYPTGVWGMSAMEAAALGKVVITNDLWRREYEEVFGECPMLVANSRGELRDAVKEVMAMSDQEISDLKLKTREWIERTHGLLSVGEKLKELLC